MGVVVRRYIHVDIFIILLISTPLVLALFLQQHPYFFVHKKKFFFSFLFVIFVQYSKRCSKNIRDRSKIEITWTWRYNYTDKNIHASTTSPETATCEVPSDVSRKLQLTLCTIMAQESCS